MVNTIHLMDNIKAYASLQLDTLAMSNPIIGFMKPIINRLIDNNMRKVKSALNLIADNEGNIDVESILTEMMQSVVNTQPFSIHTSFIGDIEIGEGLIKLNIPLTDKRLVLNTDDLETFKEMLITKSK